MNAALDFLPPPTAALRRLAQFLRDTGSPLDPRQAATEAIGQWIASAKGQFTSARPTPTRGYQWKALFLPEGTELRMSFNGRYFYACIEGDALVYGGQPLSPRQMTIAVAGDGRNAWRDLWIRLPGQSGWKPASLLRREAGRQAVAAPVSPANAMAAAAACMSETLRSALALVEHANAQALPRHERRVERQRRAQDVMHDYCKLD